MSAGSEIGRQIDEMLAAELARVGVTARVRTLEWAAFVEKVDAGDFEAASLAWSAVDPNPDPYFYWHSSQCAPKGLNDGCYANPEADRLMEEARLETRRGARTEMLRPAPPDPPRRRAGDLRRQRRAEGTPSASRVRGLTTSPLGLYGIWPGPLAWWAAPGRRAAAP